MHLKEIKLIHNNKPEGKSTFFLIRIHLGEKISIRRDSSAQKMENLKCN